MKLLDKILGQDEDDTFYFNRNKKIMASTTMDEPEPSKEDEEPEKV